MVYVRALYVAMIGFIAAAIALAAIALSHVDDKTAGTVIAAGSLMAATAGWLFSNAIALSSKLRERTFSYLNKVTVEMQISSRSAELNNLWKSENIGEISQNKLCLDRYFVQNYENGIYIKTVKELGNIFEEMSSAVRYGAVDESMLRSCMKDLVGLYIIRLSPFITIFRNFPIIENHPYGQFSSESIFEGVVWLANRWK